MDFLEIIRILKKNLRDYDETSKLENLINIGYFFGKSENMIPKKNRI